MAGPGVRIPPFRPTRSCPHRWCRWLHGAMVVCTAVALVQILFTGILSVLYFLAISVAAWVAIWAVTGSSPRQEAMKEILFEKAAEATGVVLVVRRGWANIAAACDVVFCVFIMEVVAESFAHPDASMVPPSLVEGAIAALLSLGMYLGRRFAHRQATRPAKPKRAWVPAWLGSASS
jgi:hypothetical protein